MEYNIPIDILKSIRHFEESPILWQQLAQAIMMFDGQDRLNLHKIVAEHHVSSKNAEWLRCSTLAYLTNHTFWSHQQAALIDENMPADCIMSFINMIWYQALVEKDTRNEFARMLLDIDIVRLQKAISDPLHINCPLLSPNTNPSLRIAIYTPTVHNNTQGGTNFMLNLMSLLINSEHVTCGFSAMETHIPTEASYRGGLNFVNPGQPDVGGLKLRVHGNCDIYLPDTNFSLKYRYEKILEAIVSFKPDVVLFIGFISPLIFKLVEFYPVVGLSIHALPPIVPLDVWLGRDVQTESLLWPNLPKPLVMDFQHKFWPSDNIKPVSRKLLDVPEDAILMITTGYRLDKEIKAPWIDKMCTMIDSFSDAYWLLIGIDDNKIPMNLPIHPRIKLLKPQESLHSILAIGDIYVNPPRMGGGASVTIAMEQGLPVITYSGSDGGDKVGDFAANCDSDYFDQLAIWISSHQKRIDAGAILKQRFHENLDISSEYANHKIEDALKMAIKSFNQRKGLSYEK